MLADQLEKLKDQIVDHWRREVRTGPVELQDHLPALTERIIALLRGEPAEAD